jgi:hypothetical protein
MSAEGITPGIKQAAAGLGTRHLRDFEILFAG